MTMPLPSPLVSVIVPIFNGEAHVRRCAESVLAQSHPNIELILIDDGSTDGTCNLVEDLAHHNGRIKAIHTTNGGAARARNLGIQGSRGDFLFFLDADDHLEPDALEVLIELQAKTDADLTIGAYNKVFDDDLVRPDDGGISDETLFNPADLERYVALFLTKPYAYTILAHCWGRLFRGEVLRGGVLFNENMRQLEDIELNFRYLLELSRVAYTPRLIYNYAISTSNHSNMTSKMGSDRDVINRFFIAFEPVGAFLSQRLPPDEATRLIGHYHVTTAILALIRLCRSTTFRSLPSTWRDVANITRNPGLRAHLRHYSPGPDDSRAIHFALTVGSPLLVLILTFYRLIEISRLRMTGAKRLNR